MKFLLDEMLPREAARLLHNRYGHDAVHVYDLGMGGAEDAAVAAVARGEGRAVVTENVADYAKEPELVMVCVLKRNLPAGSAQTAALAKLLDGWAATHPEPYVGQHWPS